MSHRPARRPLASGFHISQALLASIVLSPVSGCTDNSSAGGAAAMGGTAGLLSGGQGGAGLGGAPLGGMGPAGMFSAGIGGGMSTGGTGAAGAAANGSDAAISDAATGDDAQTGDDAGADAGPGETCALPSTFMWTSTGPLAEPSNQGAKSLKDFSVTQYNGKY